MCLAEDAAIPTEAHKGQKQMELNTNSGSTLFPSFLLHVACVIFSSQNTISIETPDQDLEVGSSYGDLCVLFSNWSPSAFTSTKLYVPLKDTWISSTDGRSSTPISQTDGREIHLLAIKDTSVLH